MGDAVARQRSSDEETETESYGEWKPIEGQKKKTKYRIARADGNPVTLAGLYDRWHRGHLKIDTYAILTTSPNGIMETIHNRMPVILAAADEDEWLDPATSVDTARAMCMPSPSEWLNAAHAVGTSAPAIRAGAVH
jgi:putative SOS response-associated peptidase YedK